jgi:hypothetical protein
MILTFKNLSETGFDGIDKKHKPHKLKAIIPGTTNDILPFTFNLDGR